jgi:hypothetical protein
MAGSPRQSALKAWRARDRRDSAASSLIRRMRAISGTVNSSP